MNHKHKWSKKRTVKMLSQCMLLNRLFSTKITKKPIGEIIKSFNYENKKLFGATIKSKTKTKAKAKNKGSQNSANQVNLNESERISNEKSAKSSEFYWLFKKHNGTSGKLNVAEVRKDKVNDLKQYEFLKCNKNKDVDKEVERQIIPFKNIKKILKFPLIINTNCPESNIDSNPSYDGRLPSVGKILQSTLSETSRNALINWKISKIAELGIEGFMSLQEDHLRKGKKLHSAIENFLLYKDLPDLSLDMKKLWNSVEPALQSLKPMDIKLTEARVNHPYLKYHGVVDCVSAIGNDMVIIEWKKSDKIKKDLTATFDAPLQLCAYLGALNADPKFSTLNINKGLVVVAYTNGQMAEIHKLDKTELQNYWHLWLKRLEEFWIRTRDNTLPEAI